MTGRPLPHWKQFLSRASRSRSFLWKFALATILVGVSLGALLSYTRPSHTYLFGERVLARAGLSADNDESEAQATATAPGLTDAFAEELSNGALRFIDVLWAVPTIAPHVAASDHGTLRTALAQRFDPERASLAIDFLAGWNSADEAALARLHSLAASPAPPRYARYVLGRVEMKHENYRAAFDLFRLEGETAEATESRYMAVRALVRAKEFAQLDALRTDERYRNYLTPHVALEAAVHARRWSEMIKQVPLTQLDSYRSGFLLVTAVAGLAWALFLFHLGEIRALFSGTTALCVAGLIAGVLSTTVTIFLVVVQDDILGFSEGRDTVRIFAYYIGGVGLREELSKLLLFAPLVWFLRRRDDELEALIVACFVGLGFAIEENVSYFATSQAASAPGRFLTANFFHLAMTGMNGLALFRACTRGMGGLNELLLVFPLSVLAHGAYDALLNLPQDEHGGYFAMIAYVGFCFFFFNRVHPLRTNRRMTLSLTGAFVAGIALLAATVIAFQMATLGARAGASLIFSELVGSVTLLIVFFREFNESLSD